MPKEQMKISEDKVFWYCYGTEKYRLAQTAQNICNAYMQSEMVQPDMSVIEGPTPNLDEVLNAVGTISMFGGMRLVYLPEIELSTLQDKDVKELCDLLSSMEHAVVVAYSVMKDAKQASTKKAKLLIDTAKKLGEAIELKKLTRKETEDFLIEKATALGAKLGKAEAVMLIENTGEDLTLLENEIEKLAAGAGYTTITAGIIDSLATKTLETDVFEMINAALAKNAQQAFSFLRILLDAGYDEIMISGALAGSFIDMYRVKLGQQTGHSYAQVHKDMHYTGSDWRLKKSGERAAKYSLEKLEQVLFVLSTLDRSLKSSSVANRTLLENALTEIISI